MVYVAILELPESAMSIYPSRNPLLSTLQQKNALSEICREYKKYINLFLPDLAIELPENTGINKHEIELVEGKKSLYGPIYSLGPVELEILRMYIKTYLKTGFIRPSKSRVGAPILFSKRSDSCLRLYINYRDLNNLTIKNQNSLSLISKSLDRLN